MAKKKYTVYLDDTPGGFRWRMDMDGMACVFNSKDGVATRKATLIIHDLPSKKSKKKAKKQVECY